MGKLPTADSRRRQTPPALSPNIEKGRPTVRAGRPSSCLQAYLPGSGNAYSACARASWTAALKPRRVLEAPEATSMSSRLLTESTSSQ